MSQPNGEFPTESANFNSIAALYAKNVADWEQELDAQTRGGFTKAAAGGENMRGSIYDNAAITAALMERTGMSTDILDGVGGPGSEPGQFQDWADGLRDRTREIIDNIVNGLSGLRLWNWGGEDSAQALIDQAETVASMSQAIATLQNTQNNLNTGGRSAFVDFTQRPDGPTAGDDFNQWYQGDGTGTYEIIDGKLRWVSQADDPRTALLEYNVEQTATDHQMICAAYSSSPQYTLPEPAPARNLIRGRIGDDDTSFIYAALTRRYVEIGCYVEGERTVFVTLTSGFSFKPNSMYWLQCGDVAGDRIYRVWEGTRPVLTHVEVGTVSRMGEDYRGTGAGAYAFAWFLGTNAPSSLIGWGMADNLLPELLGSRAKITRTATGNVGATAGAARVLPDNFYNNLTEGTPDITPNLTDGSFTVSLEGTYRLEAHCALGNLPNQLAMCWFRNDEFEEFIGAAIVDGEAAARTTPMWGGGVDMYLYEGDKVQLGYQILNGTSTLTTFTGTADGARTWMTLSLLNRSHA